MRKIPEPYKVAFQTENTEPLSIGEARFRRAGEFWGELEESVLVKVGHDNDPDCLRGLIKKDVLRYLDDGAKMIAAGPNRPFALWNWLDEDMWQCVKFIVAFDTKFHYIPDETDEDGEDGVDYLDDESAFRYDVIKKCNDYILEGAALAKRIGSSAYDLWVEALVRLNDEYDGSESYKAVDMISHAFARTWGDLQVWFHMNKTTKRARKTKPAVRR